MFVPATASTGFLPDYTALDPKILDRVAVAYICSPSNPQGAVASRNYWKELFELAEHHDFMVFADECYSEIYRETPPVGALQVAAELSADPDRVVIFHSLSKRSNLPGLRSGFAAGGRESIRRMKQLRDFAGAPLPLPLQKVAEHAWDDDTHAVANRALYQRKYDMVDEIFASVQGCKSPEAGFFLWLPVDDGEAATLRLWKETGVRVLPGAYLGRDTAGGNPGKGYIRVAMVAQEQEMQHGLTKLRDCLFS
jgi:aspartate/methionine/tyrosine aminotransferase